MNAIVEEVARRASIKLSDDQLARLNRYLDLLLDANQKMNLTRIVDRGSAEVHHLADSLTLLPHLPEHSHRLADVGTGGGVPGIPLAIARSDVKVTLIESTKKKASFLREAIKQLELANVAVIDTRVEEFAAHGNPGRENFDIAVARAVATLDWLVEWCLPVVKVGGKMLAMKGPKAHDELAAAQRVSKLLGGAAPMIHAVELRGAEQHVIIEIIKKLPSDRKFPRNPTIAKAKPLS